MVIPGWAQTPALKAYLVQLAQRRGIDPNSFVVGSQQASVNPRTGHQEFDAAESVPRDDVEEIVVTAPAVRINDPGTIRPSYIDVGFDPNGSGEWGLAIRHPWAAVQGWQAAQQAARETEKRYPDPNPRWNNEADAFRHARWNQLMTGVIGSDLATQFANAHEISSPNPDSERLMDLYNNQIGRDLANGSAEQIVGTLGRGALRKSPFLR